jgi:hypothetical protein
LYGVKLFGRDVHQFYLLCTPYVLMVEKVR